MGTKPIMGPLLLNPHRDLPRRWKDLQPIPVREDNPADHAGDAADAMAYLLMGMDIAGKVHHEAYAQAALYGTSVFLDGRFIALRDFYEPPVLFVDHASPATRAELLSSTAIHPAP